MSNGDHALEPYCAGLIIYTSKTPGLAISDIGCLTTLTWTNVCFTPAFLAADLPIESMEFQHLTSGAPHATFTRITTCITAFITLERCLCITVPLQVKGIFTKRRVSTIIICIFIILVASVSPMYVVNRLGWKYVPHRNKTILGLLFAENHEQVESVYYSVNSVAIPCSAFLVIVICTTVLVINLKRGTNWMKKSVVNEQAEKLAIRNQKISKMVLMISTMFICCFLPLSVVFLAMSLEPEFSLVGRYRNALSVVGGFGVVLEAVNASANIFIYSRMSSRYRAALEELLCVRADRNSSDNITNCTSDVADRESDADSKRS